MPGEEEAKPGLMGDAVSSGAVRCLSDSVQNTDPAGLSGWARGEQRGWSAGWEEVPKTVGFHPSSFSAVERTLD